MELNLNLEKTIKRYLLGTLPLMDLQAFEEKLMTEEDIFQQLLLQEDELIEDYLGSELSPEEKERFEKHFLMAPERRQKLAFAQTLSSYIATSTVAAEVVQQESFLKSIASLFRRQRPGLQVAVALGALVLVLTFSWSIREVWKLHRETEELKSQQIASQNTEINLNRQLTEMQSRNQEILEQLSQQSQLGPEHSSGSSEPGTSISLPLSPGLVRDLGGMKKISIPQSAKLVELSLSLIDEEYPKYRGMIYGVGGEELMALSGIAPARKGGSSLVLVPVPASLLSPGDYYVKLSGQPRGGPAEEIGKYYFRVSKK